MESSQEKSLPASERKLQKTREDGQGARSRDLSHLAILGAGAACLLVLAPQLMDHMQRAMSQQLAFDAATVMAPGTMLKRLQDMVVVGLVASAVFAILTSAAALISAIGAGGWILSLKPITPQFNRLNPISGLANLFSKQQMANVAKMVLMTAILSYVAWKFMGNSIDTVAMLVLQPSPMAIRQLADWLTSGMSLLLLVVFLAALVDVPLQAYFFKSRLKMSHEEVKQEHKESDGNPHTKGRIRQKQREIADRASVGAVQGCGAQPPHPHRPRQRGRSSQGRFRGDEPHPLCGGTQVRRKDHECPPSDIARHRSHRAQDPRRGQGARRARAAVAHAGARALCPCQGRP